MYFDTHAHYDDSAFDSDLGALLPELYASGVGLIIDPGCDVKSSRAAIALAEEYSFVYAAVGIRRSLQAPPRAISRSSASLPRMKNAPR